MTINLRRESDFIQKSFVFKEGEKVTYVSLPYKTKQGIIKSKSNDGYYFVVYNCAGEWNNYFDYTAQRTDGRDLVKGWI